MIMMIMISVIVLSSVCMMVLIDECMNCVGL